MTPPARERNGATVPPPRLASPAGPGKRARRDDTSPSGPASNDGVDWGQVAIWRTELVTRLEAIQREAGIAGLDADTLRERGRSIIRELIEEFNNRALASGDTPIAGPLFTANMQAVFNARFGLGRLQPLLELDGVEDVYIIGYDNVSVRYTDGRTEQVDPVAGSDEELIETVANLAVWNDRAFDRSNTTLHMDLPDTGARLFATAWTSHRPQIVLRRHRHTHISLDDLVEMGSLNDHAAEFLRAAVRARLNIVVAGDQGAGKTTLLRALAGAMEPGERFTTIETEYELHLQDNPGTHPQVVAFEARPGSGELRGDGTRAGAVTERELLHDSLRGSFQRTIVGEVRGIEIWPMIEAMLSGSGSLSTTHAKAPDQILDRLYMASIGSGASYDEVMRALGLSIDLTVYVSKVTHAETGHRQRRVTHITLVGPAKETVQPTTHPVYELRGNDLVFESIPEDTLRRLTLHGLPRHNYLQGLT